MSAPQFEVELQEDAFSRAEELATVLQISDPEALGHLCYLWRWILTQQIGRAPDGIVRGRASVLRLEGAARWKGKRGAFVDALVAIGFVVRERKKLKVKGTKRYADAWKKKDAARRRERARRIEMKRQAASGEKNLPKLSVVRGKVSDEARAWWQWAMYERSKDTFKPGVDPFSCARAHALLRAGVPADFDMPKSFGEWFDARMKEGITSDSLKWAWDRYLGDNHFESRQHPLPIFMSDGVYRKRTTKSA